ncbi:translation elongation factor Ts [Acidocella sp. KAb 2-4]|uniref:translation elongation factor Ts n=1 Tax=Acidocella sp. KAb 2-4 TaxID=2885158 RepID=UPI001D082465|nr:translation elongation factor Ts [Acidocella sp. KAb 2-4]MCB5943170.1 translation elongation factor Ts [Acidocella sp. KAb 2-4]
MAEITAALVKELRELTGAGMMDCKKALTEANGDKEAAIDWLRKKGLAAAAKKSGRVAAEGLVGVALGNGKAAVVEVNSETDFVARNEAFQNYVETVAKLALDVGEDVEALKAAAYPGTGRTVAEEAVNLVATIGENMNVRRVAVITAPVVGAYIHGALKPGLGKIGVIVGLTGADEQLARQIGMHVAATRPDALSVAEVDPAALEREKNVLSEQARASGKPEAIIEKMVEGRVKKYYEDVVLLEQTWVHDGESKVKDVAKKAGADITRFVRFTLGEGIEKEVSDFAAEVAAAAGV